MLLKYPVVFGFEEIKVKGGQMRSVEAYSLAAGTHLVFNF